MLTADRLAYTRANLGVLDLQRPRPARDRERPREVDSNPRSLSLDSREEKGRRSIRVVAKDAVPFLGGTVGSNLVPSAKESASPQKALGGSS
jgi:hypothetical protein